MQLDTEFQYNLLLLDAALTGKPWHDVFRGAYQKHFRPYDFLEGGGLYYLSDGGYSRVGWSEVTGKLFLASESTPRTKELWPYTEQIRLAIEQDMYVFWERESGEPFEPI